MMQVTGSQKIILAELQATLSPLWQSEWASCVARYLANQAYEHIDWSRGVADPEFATIDDASRRIASLRANTALAVSTLTQKLLEHSAQFNQMFATHGVSKRSKNELRTLLAFALPQLLVSSEARNILVSVGASQIWPSLANRIAEAVYKEESTGTCPEWLLWNKLLLARFFQGCLLKTAREAAAQMATFREGLHGPRSHLIAIVERLDGQRVIDQLPQLMASSISYGTTFHSSSISDLIASVESESGMMTCGRGIIHRVANVDAPASIPARLQGHLTETQLKTFRDHAFRQHEAAFLGFGVLCSIEQLLRALASHQGVAHLRAGGVPRPVGGWLGELGLDQDLRDLISALYSSANGPNLRNRAMHSGLLETKSRGLEVLLAANQVGTKAVQHNNATVAENLCRIFLECLKKLDDHCGTVRLVKQDFFWSRSLWLTPEEAEFGHRLSCDLLDPDSGLECRAQLLRFVNLSLPCYSTQFQTALYSWLDSFQSKSSVLLLVIWANVFEALYRLTLHVIGFSVIQRSSYGPETRMYQYRMLDATEGGLCSSAALEALLECLRPQDRPAAWRTIALAVKIRNALAHGAIWEHNEHNHLAAGHLVIKATQLLMEATRRHFIREAAYFRSLECPHSPEVNWLSAERDVDTWMTVSRSTMP